MLSGMTYKPVGNQDKSKVLLGKIDRILLPWFFFSIISSIISYAINYNESTAFNGPLWYLQTLFISYVTYMIMQIYLSMKQLNFVVIVIAAVITIFTNYSLHYSSNLYIVQSLAAIVFIHTGTFIPSVAKVINSSLRKKIIRFIICVCVFTIMYLVYRFVLQVESYSFVKTNFFRSFPLYYIASIAGSLAVLLLVCTLPNFKFLSFIGQNSLVVMAVHFPLMQELNRYAAKTELYYLYGYSGKIILSIIIVSITLLFSLSIALLAKRYVPHLTGYKRLFKL